VVTPLWDPEKMKLHQTEQQSTRCDNFKMAIWIKVRSTYIDEIDCQLLARKHEIPHGNVKPGRKVTGWDPEFEHTAARK
jgi:hypothetical protein